MAALVVGAVVLANGYPLRLMKVQAIQTQTVRDGRKIGGMACVAVLSGGHLLIEPSKKAVILRDTAIGSAIRACGFVGRIVSDVPTSEFVCLRGQMPSMPIAQMLQKEAAVMWYDNGLVVRRIDEALKAEPVLRLDDSAIATLQNPTVERHSRSAYVSINDDGASVEGANTTDSRPVGYMPRYSERQLLNLEKVLVRRATILRPFDMRLQAGGVVLIGDKRLMILTAAHRYDTGAMGGASVAASKLWLASL